METTLNAESEKWHYTLTYKGDSGTIVGILVYKT